MDASPTKTKAAERIRSARRGAGMSQERLAAALSTTRQVVIRWEGGFQLPSETSRQKLADVLGGKPGFYGGEDEEEDSIVVTADMRDMLILLRELLGRAISCDDVDELCPEEAA